MLGAGAYTENFRSALNGFNRTDVVQFIQRQTVEHEKSMRLLREENARLKQAAAEPKNDMRALLSEKDVLAQQLAHCKEELATLTQQNRDLSAKVSDLSRQNAELIDRISALNRQNTDLVERLGSLDRQNTDLNVHLDQNTTMSKQIEILTRENADLRVQLETRSHENAEAALQLEALTCRNAELQEQSGILAGQLADSRGQLEALAEEKVALTQSLQEAQEALAAAEAAKAEAPSLLDRPISAPAGLAAPPSSFDELELAAYRRAEQTERMARERAVASSNRIQNIFRQADEKMILTAADMNILLENMSTNYAQMQVLMENARNILSESAENLKVSADLSSVV